MMGRLAGRMIKKVVGYGLALAGYCAGSSRAHGGPVSVAVEPTNICNLRCPLCATGAGLLKRPRGSMSLRDFTRVADSLPRSVTDLYLWGQGEPFLAPDFLHMAAYAHDRGLRTHVSTNGHFMDDPDGIVASGIDRLIVSLDGRDEKTYSQYRVGGDFGRVVAGIEALAARKKANGAGPLIEIQCLVTRDNAGDIDAIRHFARSLGADHVVFKTLQAAFIEDGDSLLPGQHSLTRYRSGEDGRLVPDTRAFLGNRCMRIYYSFQVDWQGNVLPCCFDKDSSYPLGNILTGTVADIWNGTAYRLFRERLREKGRILPMCSDCTEGLKRMNVNGKRR